MSKSSREATESAEGAILRMARLNWISISTLILYNILNTPYR